MENTDVLIVGAGLSGIGAAAHLTRDCPDKSFEIVEARSAIGGTWDLFRYPGIRSDSDMHTLGYVFKPWTKAKAIADGSSIREYVVETAEEYGVKDRIRFDHKVVRAEWSSADARWTVTMDHEGEERQIACRFLFMNSGYYDYDRGYRPKFPGEEAFQGRFVHPQHWPADLDYKDKRVVVIGSGATAVTLVPELAKEAAQTVMLQRSPTWMVSRPAKDKIANFLRKVLGDRLGYKLARWKNIRMGDFFFRRARSNPQKVGAKLLEMLRGHLRPGYDIDTHLTPSYGPWEQRLCLVPDADFFEALNRGAAEIVTDHIDRFETDGIRLTSGKFLQADIVVTATGLNLKMLGGMEMVVDGRTVGPQDTYPYKGVMFSGVPNLAATFGYTNASWTLKADITAQYVCRLIHLMDERGTEIATPKFPVGEFEEQPFSNLSSGYFARAEHLLPKSTDTAPWQQPHDYLNDRKWLLKGELDDGTIDLARKGARPQPEAKEEREPLPVAAE